MRSIRSTTGMSSTSPGPLAPIRRPRRKTTPRSYSRSTRTEAPAKATRIAATTARAMRTAVMSDQLSGIGLAHAQREAADALDDDVVALVQLLVVLGPLGPRPPQGAVDEDLPDRLGGAADYADVAHDALRAAPRPAPAGTRRLQRGLGDHGAGDKDDDDGDRHREGHAPAGGRDQGDRPARERADAERPEDAGGREVGLRRQQPGAHREKHEAERNGHLPACYAPDTLGSWGLSAPSRSCRKASSGSPAAGTSPGTIRRTANRPRKAA